MAPQKKLENLPCIRDSEAVLQVFSDFKTSFLEFLDQNRHLKSREGCCDRFTGERHSIGTTYSEEIKKYSSRKIWEPSEVFTDCFIDDLDSISIVNPLEIALEPRETFFEVLRGFGARKMYPRREYTFPSHFGTLYTLWGFYCRIQPS